MLFGLPSQREGYKLLNVLGSGAFGTVYKAEVLWAPENAPRYVAIKVRSRGPCATVSVCLRFLQSNRIICIDPSKIHRPCVTRSLLHAQGHLMRKCGKSTRKSRFSDLASTQTSSNTTDPSTCRRGEWVPTSPLRLPPLRPQLRVFHKRSQPSVWHADARIVFLSRAKDKNNYLTRIICRPGWPCLHETQQQQSLFVARLHIACGPASSSACLSAARASVSGSSWSSAKAGVSAT